MGSRACVSKYRYSPLLILRGRAADPRSDPLRRSTTPMRRLRLAPEIDCVDARAAIISKGFAPRRVAGDSAVYASRAAAASRTGIFRARHAPLVRVRILVTRRGRRMSEMPRDAVNLPLIHCAKCKHVICDPCRHDVRRVQTHCESAHAGCACNCTIAIESAGASRSASNQVPVEFDEWFRYHAPTLDDLIAYQHIRDAARVFAEAILANTSRSADQSAALRKVREAMMTANAARACGGK